MSGHNLIAIGGSAGSLEPLQGIVASLPADLPAAVLITLHQTPSGNAYLSSILNRLRSLPAEYAADREELLPGRIYLAPPDHHLLVEDGKGDVLRLSHGPKEQHTRPAIDPLFRSVAEAAGPHAVGVLLSGNLSDGTLGMLAIHRVGGITMVQDPEDALFPSMPANAIRAGAAEIVLPASAIADRLTLLARDPVAASRPNTAPARGGKLTASAEITAMACPDCGGTLRYAPRAFGGSFLCRVGHAYEASSREGRLGEVAQEYEQWARHSEAAVRTVEALIQIAPPPDAP